MKKYRSLSIVLCLTMLLSLLVLPAGAWDGFRRNDADRMAELASDDRIHYISVNTEHNNDCFLVESNGLYLLVDTSNPDLHTGGAQAVANDTATVNEAIRYLSAIGVSSLDYVVLTHNHSDHIGGVTRLCEEGLINSATTVYYRTAEPTMEDVFYPYWENTLYLRRGIDAMNSVGAQLICLAEENITELTLQLGDFSIEFLNLDNDQDGVVDFDRGNENNNSIVLLVTKGTVDTLLAGDIEAEAERALAEQLGPVEVLKVPHHGNRTSSSYEFMKAVQPEAAVITATGYWQYGAYEYMTNLGGTVYTTGACPGLAIVEVVMDDSYDMIDGVPYETTPSEGWHDWLNYYYYVENGQLVRSDWEWIDGAWYYFNEDGVMQTGEAAVDGITYHFRDSGELIRE